MGRPLPGLDLKLVDDDGKDVSAPGARGELCVRGPTVINGYFENPEANARDWDSEGYFHTGDIAFMDAKTELLYIVDRKKVLECHPDMSVMENADSFARNSSKSERFKWRLPNSKAPCSIILTSSTLPSSAFLIQAIFKALSCRELTW